MTLAVESAEHLSLVETDRLVFGIETSCDETAAAIVANGKEVLSSVVSSQIDLHASYGGVVPEIAGRAHIERILPVVNEALEAAGFDKTGRDPDGRAIAAVAATYGPGLVGSLLVGVSAAKALALSWGVPFVGVNHLEGHLYAAFLEHELSFPVVVLLVSGGHTLLISMQAPGHYELLGATVDDAAGEAFDKVARYLGLSYPGGPAIEKAARNGNPKAVHFTRPMLHEGRDFSFSGLKTAVVQEVRAHGELATDDVAASFQEAVVDVLSQKALEAARATGATGICLAGGVAANGPLRERVSELCEQEGLSAYLPTRAMCTDNAAMIAAAGYYRYASDGPSRLSTGAVPDLVFPA